MDTGRLRELAKLVRYYILEMTTQAGSGHPTSSLSAADVMVALFFNKLRFDLKNPQNPANDRVIFSKGHVSPLIYALYAAAGVLKEKDLDDYRRFKSVLEGHPTPRFKYIEAATGSLGQGLSVGFGMALALRREFPNSKLQIPKVYVLMGDSETSEGSVWEAIELASYYKLGNLVGIIDVNRLGQSGQTMLGWDVEKYKRRIEAFGWQVSIVDGHDLEAIVKTFNSLPDNSDKPQMIIAKTIKGKGVSFLEDKEGWHGKALSKEEFGEAVRELGEVDRAIRGKIQVPGTSLQLSIKSKPRSDTRTLGTGTRQLKTEYKLGEMVATRKAYGEAITALAISNPEIVCLDAEVKNSTYAEIFKEKFPERFFEMFIAEQNMVSAALGFSKRGKIPFVSTFAAFFTRAFDQIRMAAYSRPNIKFAGSHAGVSIGEDGPSQMGLEDISMFRSIFGSVVLCPGDAVACEKLVEMAARLNGLFYIRTNRPATPVIYGGGEKFKIGGSKVVRSSQADKLTIVACGVTLIEAIKAADELAKQGIKVRLVDVYSIKPIDEATIKKAANEANNLVITVEDHYFEGGLGDAVLSVFANQSSHPRGGVRLSSRKHLGGVQVGGVQIHKLAVSKLPMSGKSDQLLDYEGISSLAIAKRVREILG